MQSSKRPFLFAPNNGAILTIAQMLKELMSSVAETKIGVFYIKAQNTVYKNIGGAGNPQPPMHIISNNYTANGIINNKIQPKCTKAMNMHFYLLCNREAQEQLQIGGEVIIGQSTICWLIIA